ncbi:hypothetical protein [Nostoc sp.]|uniref:hypothetical protein n=1 Tax=Nostoc sp. TaxID=1180 RepID=UPI002FF4755C
MRAIDEPLGREAQTAIAFQEKDNAKSQLHFQHISRHCHLCFSLIMQVHSV